MAAPSTKLPSTVISGILRVLKEMKTPSVIIAYMMPISVDPCKIAISASNVIDITSFGYYLYSLGMNSAN
jgi:hypothetical protein